MSFSEFSLSKLQTQHNWLSRFLTFDKTEILFYKQNPEKWSIHEHLAHLGRYQEIFEERLREIISGGNPNFDRYIAEKDKIFKEWVLKDTKTILEDIFSKRSELIQILENCGNYEIHLKGCHPKLGKMDLEGWLDFFLLHETHHFYSIFWLEKLAKQSR